MTINTTNHTLHIGDGGVCTRVTVSVASTPITGITFDWSTHRRESDGGDNWPTTWASNGNQYSSGGDGWGWSGNDSTKSGQYVVEIAGTKDDYTGTDKYLSHDSSVVDLSGKSYAILAVSGVLYMFLAPGSGNNNFDSQTLYKSTDDGLTWNSVGVTFDRATYNLCPPGFLQFGQNYANARDGYIYIYAADIKDDATTLPIQDDATDGGEIWLLRVPIADIETQGSYEWFTGSSASPTWGAFADRTAVYQSDDGVGWSVSCNWVPGLNRYLLATEFTTSKVGNLRIFESPEPWGAWTQIHSETNFPQSSIGSAYDPVDATSFYLTFAPKWWDQAGNGVALLTGIGTMDSWNSVEVSLQT